MLAGEVAIACVQAGLRFEKAEGAGKFEWAFRLDTTDPDVTLIKEESKPYAVAVIEVPVLETDRELLRRLEPRVRNELLPWLFEGWVPLGVQWLVREEDGVWSGFQISRRIFPEHLQGGALWDRVESVVDGGFVVRASLLRLRAQAGAALEPSPLPRRLKAEVRDVIDYTVVHTSKESARWIHQAAERWQVSTEAVVDRLVAAERGKPARLDA
ncbi:MAG: DUF2299 family protein [Candidatus Thermoplasmatota archaeon]